MALAAKLLVGALVLGAGSTATYVAVTGGFGAGGNGAESEASGETQVAASSVAGSSGPQVESAPGQGQNQPVAPAESAVDSSRGADANRGTQVQTGDTAEEPVESEERSGVSVPGQEVTTDISQTPAVGSSQSLPTVSNDAENGRVANAASDVVGDEVAGKSSKPEGTSNDEHNNSIDGQKSGNQAANAQTQPAGQEVQGGGTSEQGVTPPATPRTVQGPNPTGGDVAGTLPESTTPSGAADGTNRGTTDTGSNLPS